MSRKSKENEDQSVWQMPSIYAFVGEYGPFKAKGFDPIENTLVWFCNTGETNDGGNQTQRRHDMFSLAGPIQELLLSEKGKKSKFTAVLVIDINDMFENREEYHEALENEIEAEDLTKKFGKKLLRLFQKLLLHRVAIAAKGELCMVLLKLYKALEKLDASHNLEENNTIAELWLLHPELSEKYIDTHLVVPKAGPKKGKGKGKGKGKTAPAFHTHPVQLNLVHAPSASKPISALKPFFPVLGTELVTDTEINDWFSVISKRKDSKGPPESYDSTRCNNLGKMLFMSDMKVEMNKFSKQYERNCSEITADLLKIVVAKQESADDDQDGGAIDWSACERHVGALLLRGNRCVLVRSVYGEWEGMRIPSVVPEPNETPHEAAIRAIEEFAEVDPSELRALPHVLPVAIYGPNDLPILVELHALYAVNPPPEGSEDAADEEDEEDDYDWYRFPKAIARLDQRSGEALRTMAMNLLQASSVGLVPTKWGGVFGQELQLEGPKKFVS